MNNLPKYSKGNENLFFEEIDRISKIVKTLINEKSVKLISHYDADGISSASIMIKALMRENVEFELRIIKQLTEERIENLIIDDDQFLILSDLGSGQIDNLWPILDKTQILILDHHDPIRKDHMNLFHINPLLFSEEEISASMVCYLFAKSLNVKNTDLIDLGIVGAIGDIMDEKWELRGIGRDILEEAEMLGKISVEKGLRLYGRNSRPLYKSLEYSSDTHIPNITGSESNAVQFISELGIEMKDNGKWRRLKDLTIDEQKKLASAIIVERLKHGQEDADDVFGEIYNIVGRPEEIQDVREFATLLNACGRTGNFYVGIRLCLGDLSALKKSWDISKEYRRMISRGINWVRKGNADEYDDIVVINGEGRIPDSVIGTVSSITLSSGLFDGDKIVLGFADGGDGKLKVSSRMPRDLRVNLRDILVEASSKVGGEAGGHPFAAGAFIDLDKKQEFIKIIRNKISKSTTN